MNVEQPRWQQPSIASADMSKEIYIAAHEELIGEYLERHPNATEAQAYDITADAAYDRYRDKYADMVDRARQRAKDEQW